MVDVSWVGNPLVRCPSKIHGRLPPQILHLDDMKPGSVFRVLGTGWKIWPDQGAKDAQPERRQQNRK